MITRRNALISTLFGAGTLGLRALATGLPAWFLVNPKKALADGAMTCANNAKAQYLILSTSGNGDPINANVPGTYEDKGISHSLDPSMAATQFNMGGQPFTAAKPWASLPQTTLDRTTFWHLMTNTPIHPKEPDVLKLMGTAYANEMFPSIIAKAMAPCLGTVQAQPLSVGASTPAEALSFGGSALPVIPPLALKETLLNPVDSKGNPTPLSKLQPLRDQTLNQLYDLYRTNASPAQKAYIDSLVTSQQQVRNINQSLLAALNSITDNSPISQITAAIALIQMNVSPLISMHIPFGGDNHRDVALATETAQTAGDGLLIGDPKKKVFGGVETIGYLIDQLTKAGLQDKVTFMSLNVFGRTLSAANYTDGRTHNGNHQVSVTIGKPFKPGVVGGVTTVAGDYGCTGIDSASGKANASGDVAPVATLPSFAQTVLSGLGADPTYISTNITAGKVITGAIA